MNTLVYYLYRDGSNYKVHNEVVLKGEITPEQISAIAESLDSGENFIPSQVGLPERRFENWTEDDGPWFELDPNTAFSCTEQESTVEMTVDELVAKFVAAKGAWDDGAVMPSVSDCQPTAQNTEGGYLFVIEGNAADAAKPVGQPHAFRITKKEAEDMVKIALCRGIPKERIHVFPLSSDILQ